MTLLQFRNEDARIAYLATVYHLGRPGSETDPRTLQKHDLGLQAVHDEMAPRLDEAVVQVEASSFQILKLAEALRGVTNELKQFGLADGHSMVPRFEDTVHRLYPETKDEPGAAMDIVAHAVALQRRMNAAVAEAQREVDQAVHQQEAERHGRRPWWKFWGRRS